jgi:hypothetical protein
MERLNGSAEANDLALVRRIAVSERIGNYARLLRNLGRGHPAQGSTRQGTPSQKG